MDTLKKFWIYFLIFLAIFLLISGLTNIVMGDNYVDTSYEIVCSSPEIIITDCKATTTTGYIRGNITNNTEEHIPIKYLQIDIYGENDVYLGSEIKELKYFNVNETINFDINYQYNNVDRLVIGIADKILEEEKEKEANTVAGIEIEPEITEETIKIGVPIGIMLSFNTLLGLF